MTATPPDFPAGPFAPVADYDPAVRAAATEAIRTAPARLRAAVGGLADVRLEGNSAIGGNGGAIESWYATLDVRSCVFRGNSTPGLGGGILAFASFRPAEITIEQCIFEENTAGDGGGVCRRRVGGERDHDEDGGHDDAEGTSDEEPHRVLTSGHRVDGELDVPAPGRAQLDPRQESDGEHAAEERPPDRTLRREAEARQSLYRARLGG